MGSLCIIKPWVSYIPDKHSTNELYCSSPYKSEFSNICCYSPLPDILHMSTRLLSLRCRSWVLDSFFQQILSVLHVPGFIWANCDMSVCTQGQVLWPLQSYFIRKCKCISELLNAHRWQSSQRPLLVFSCLESIPALTVICLFYFWRGGIFYFLCLMQLCRTVCLCVLVLQSRTKHMTGPDETHWSKAPFLNLEIQKINETHSFLWFPEDVFIMRSSGEL